MSPGKRDGCRVNVYVRSRPLPSDDPTGISSLLFPDVNKVIIQDARHDTIYKFDHVFPLDSTNAEVCKVVSEPLVSAVFSGNNGSFLVYGQTGAGKTHTVLYTGGVIPTTIENIFAVTKSSDHCTYKVFLSYLQIYQERIYDLLLNEFTGPLNLREHPREGIIIEGLSEEEVTSEEDAKKLIEIGQKKLIVTHTKASPFSSRSHAVCVLKVCKYFSYSEIIPELSSQIASEKRPVSPVQYECGKLNICDLAGTERSTKLRTTSGRRLDESRHINTSLLELGNVIHALATKNKPYIPFRNSCLTRILQDSLGGNSKASLMVCISASVNDIKETKCSLNFGQRAMKVMKETIANTQQPQVDPQWLTNSCRRKRLKKTDYKILSKYLTSKLKELELAYKLEKENLDALKRNKQRENPDGLDEDLITSTPSILKRSLGVLTEEFGSREEVTHSTVETGINTDILDTYHYEHKSNALNYNTPLYVSSTCQVDFDTCPRENEENTELIPINETMSESLLIERIFNPDDTLPFQVVRPAATQNVSYTDRGTEMDGIHMDIDTSTHCMIEECGDDETPIITYNFNYISSQGVEASYAGHNAKTMSERQNTDTISVGVGTSFEDIHHFNGCVSSNHTENTTTCTEMFEYLTENVGEKNTVYQLPSIRSKEITTSSDKEVQANLIGETFSMKESYTDSTYCIPRDIKTYSNASTQFEVSNSDEVINVTNLIANDNEVITVSSCDLTPLTLRTQDNEEVCNVIEEKDDAIDIQFGTIKPSSEPKILCNNMKDSNHSLDVQFENIKKLQCDKSEMHLGNNKIEEYIPYLEQTSQTHLCNNGKKDAPFSEYSEMDHLPPVDTQCLEQTQLCNGKTQNMQSLELFDKHANNNSKSDECMQYLNERTEKCPRNNNSKTDDNIMEDMQCLQNQTEKHIRNDKTNVDVVDDSQCFQQSETRVPNDHNMKDVRYEKIIYKCKADKNVIADAQCNDIKSDSTKLTLDKPFKKTVVNIVKDINIVENGRSDQNNVAVDTSINDKRSGHDTVNSIEIDATGMGTSIEVLCSNAKHAITGNMQVNNNNGSTNTQLIVSQSEKELYHTVSTNSGLLANQCEKEIYMNGSNSTNNTELSLNLNDDIACNKHIDNIENDIVIQEEVKEQFVEQLCSYMWENMDFDTATRDNITQVHDCIREIKFDNVTERDDINFERMKENECNVVMSGQQSQTYLYHNAKQNIDIVDNSSGVKADTRAKKTDTVNINDEFTIDITEVPPNDTMKEFNNKNDISNKREICVQTDETCIAPRRRSNHQNVIPTESRGEGEYLPCESDEERERFMNRFCYSASQHIAGDTDFEYREAKYMRNSGDEELYQGCLVYLTDTDSVSDYSEMSEDSSVFSDFTKCDGDSEETLQAKLLMDNIKNKYEMLLSEFDLVSSERSRLQGETRKRNCYDLLTNFKSALEEELLKLGEHSGRSSASDSNESRRSFSPSQNIDQSRLSRDLSKQSSLLGIQELIKPGKRKPLYSGDIDMLQLERTSPDGAQQKTITKNSRIVTEPLDENNNVKNDIDFREMPISSRYVPENIGQKEISKSNQPKTDHLFERYHSLRLTPITHSSTVSLERTPADISIYSKISSPTCRSISLQDHAIDTSYSIDGLPTTEHEKLKRELMLTKLEKSRLEAVLSCVLLTNDIDIDDDSNLKNLTMSRSTLSSSTSMAQLQKLSRTSSPFQTIAFPMRSYNYKDRRFTTPESLPALSNLAQVVSSRQRSRARSIPETDEVNKWLSQDNANSLSELSQDGSTISPGSSFAEITSMSDMETPCVSTQELHPLSPDKEKFLEDLSLDKDMDDVDMDSLLEQLQKKEKFPLACVPFIKRRSIRKKLKKAKKLCESQSSGIS